MSEPERDVLDEALIALREETAESSKDAASAAATRKAIILAAGTRRRRSVLVRLVLPIAAVLAASTAWAAATGRLPGFFHAASESPAPLATPAPVAVVTSSVPAASLTASVLAPSPSPPPSATMSAPPVAANPPVVPRASAGAAAIDPEDALYRAAHEAHFVGKDPARALAAWDAYLAAHPKGRFAPEARYNRALTFIRLGRTDDARAALRPFADGTLGGYRQKEATQLLEAME